MSAKEKPKSANFNFLAKRYPDLERIGALCEHYFTFDPIVALITLRQFGDYWADGRRSVRSFDRPARTTGRHPETPPR
jgi:hypothetical protein